MARGMVLLSWSVELKIPFALRVRKQSLSAKNCRAGLHPSCILCCLLASIVRSDDFQEVRSSDLRVWGFLLPNELRFFLETYIVSGCITIIKSSQQLTLNHWVFPPARQQSTLNTQQSTIIIESTVNTTSPKSYNSSYRHEGCDFLYGNRSWLFDY